MKKYIEIFDSTSHIDGVEQFVKIPMKYYYAGDYRLEYDGKYITLFGRHRAYKGFKFSEDQEDWYEEMVLVPLVAECRRCLPTIEEITTNEIIVALNTYSDEKS